MNDAEVIARIVGGEIGAFRRLVESHQPVLLRYLRNMVGDDSEAEDLAQETFLAAYRSLPKYDAQLGSFRTWLLWIGRNKCINVLRKRKSNCIPLDDSKLASEKWEPTNEATQREMFRRLDLAITQLPDEQRSAFLLFQLEGLSYDEIAALEGIQLGTVKSRIARARRFLQAAVDDFLRVQT